MDIQGVGKDLKGNEGEFSMVEKVSHVQFTGRKFTKKV
jgi:hypothetical protein